MPSNDVEIRVGAHDTSQASLDELKAKIQQLGRMNEEAVVGLDDKQAQYAADKIKIELDRLDKRVASPRINASGIASTELALERIDLQLDAIGKKDVSPKVTVEPGVIGMFKGIFEAAGNDIMSILGKSVSDGVDDGAKEGGSVLENVLSMPGVGLAVAGSITAAVGVAAPLIAQALAGSLVLGLGAGLAGLGIYAASKLKPVKDAFDSLEKAANDDLTQIGKPFEPVLVGLLGTAKTVLGELTKPFTDAEKTIAKPFQELGTTLGQSFASPAVKTSIGAIATAFAAIAKAITPQVGTDVKNIASAITNIANAITAHSQGFADFIRFLTLLVTWTLDVISALTRVAGWLQNEWKHAVQAAADVVSALVSSYKDDQRDIENIWTTLTNDAKTLWHDIVNSFTSLKNDVKATWNTVISDARSAWNTIKSAVTSAVDNVESDVKKAWNSITSATKSAWNSVVSVLKSVWGDIKSAVSSGVGSVKSTLSNAWNSVFSTVKSSWNSILSFIGGIPHKAVVALANLGPYLHNVATDAFNDLLHGFENVGGSILSWLGGFVSSVISKVKSLLHIGSPSGVFAEIGMNMMLGLEKGIKGGANKAADAATAAAKASAAKASGGGGAGLHPTGSGATVEALMKSMAASVGWTGSQWTDLYNVEMREAGFNIHAQNPNSGAYGLAQFINGPSEYYQYGGNPNTAAGQITGMLNYIKDRYRTPAAAWAHEESAGWYGAGGATTAGLAMVGEHGRELLSLPGGSHVYSNPDTERMLAGGGAANVNITFAGGGTPVEQLFLQVLRKIVRVQGGGSVQKALGYGS